MITTAQNVVQGQIYQARGAICYLEERILEYKTLNDEFLRRARTIPCNGEFLLNQYEKAWGAEDELEVEHAARVLFGLVLVIGTSDGAPAKVLPQIEALKTRKDAYLLEKRAVFEELLTRLR